MAEDPICGMMVDPAIGEFKTDYNGQTYYFCSKACQSKFEIKSARSSKKKGFLTRFLERIAKASTKEFGSTPPSCCGH